jgi:eukaryotic-like serine/threonine-protein kinase
VSSPAAAPSVLDPAHQLTGRMLDGNWRVLERASRNADDTGGRFSVGYVVEDGGGRRAFLKALDYAPALRGGELATLMSSLTEGYLFERQILSDCERRGMNRIVRVLAAGTIVDSSFAHSVDYLIFEPAEGDVRRALDAMSGFDIAWALTVCHHAAVAVSQLHRAGVAHQDVKPSNLLTFADWLAKLGDLGRCSQRGVSAPHDREIVRGDPVYAPPELLYGQVDPDWSVRCQACDWYLLGSLILFIFTRTQTTAELIRRIPEAMRPDPFGEPFTTALPYLVNAFDELCDDFEIQLEGPLATELVAHFRSLCHPDPARRGDPIQRRRGKNPYDLQRVISRLDVLAREARAGYLHKKPR